MSTIQAAESDAVPRVAPETIRSTAPLLAWYSDHLLFHRVWNRPGLTRRERSVVTVSALVASSSFAQLPGHIGRALDHGVGPEELADLICGLAFDCGWPSAMTATKALRGVMDERGLDGDHGILMAPDHGSDAVAVGASARELIEAFTDQGEAPPAAVLGLPGRERALALLSTAAARQDWAGMQEHLATSVPRLLDVQAVRELCLHLAFYLGKPRALRAASLVDVD